jgi:hypothetical protein
MAESSLPPSGQFFRVIAPEPTIQPVPAWLRVCVAALESIFGGALGGISIYVSIRPPQPVCRPMWIGASILCVTFFVIAAVCRGVLDAREKKADDARRIEVDRGMAERMETLVTQIAGLRIDTLRFEETSAPATEPVTHVFQLDPGHVSLTGFDATFRKIRAPDVSLRFQLPNDFELHNYGGHAVDVSIDPVTIPEYVAEMWDSMPVRMPEQVVRFPTIDLDSESSKEITPIYTYHTVPMSKTTMSDFLKQLIKKRQIETFRERKVPSPTDATPHEYFAYIDDQLRQQNEPIDVDLRVIYTNRDTGKRWQRIETLHYEPKYNSVRIVHGKPREITEPSDNGIS